MGRAIRMFPSRPASLILARPMSASSALIDRWRAHLALDRRRSVHTVRAYQATAERLVAFLEQHRGEAVTQAMLASLEQADLRAFLTSRRVVVGRHLGRFGTKEEIAPLVGLLAEGARIDLVEAQAVVDLGAGPAGAGRAHLPKIVLPPGEE